MDNLKSAVVMPNFATVGIQSKNDRGVVAEHSDLPVALATVQSALQRIAAKLGVDLSQTGDALRLSFEKAITSKPASAAPSISRDSGLALG